ncbi:sulfate adenylyltransferase (ADP) / ATP adenylyltransferase, partial [Phenoliferia sp. Uapishka_3]
MSTAMPFPGLGPKIKASYAAGVKAGAVHFTESEVEEVDENGIPLEIRFAPALAKKPTGDKPDTPKDTSDPFAPPYTPELFLAEDVVKESETDVGEEYVVLLNKYCVTPRHFLLVTKEFEKQQSPLTPSQLLAAYSILRQLGQREKFLAFFNCGPNSGASQPHKHIQFIPLSNGVAPFDAFIQAHQPEKSKSPFQLPLPYAQFTCMINPPPGADLARYLGGHLFALIDLLIDHLRRLSMADETNSIPLRLSALSYNIIMTEAYISLIPRTKESYTLEGGEEVSINAIGYTGAILVKTQSALDGIKKLGVLAVLAEVGFPPVAPGGLPEAEELE